VTGGEWWTCAWFCQVSSVAAAYNVTVRAVKFKQKIYWPNMSYFANM